MNKHERPIRIRAALHGLVTCALVLAAAVPPAGPAVAQARDSAHLRAEGRRLVGPDGQPFDWRGITAFRLVEMVAHGRASEAESYLAWARARSLSIVRVFSMASQLFELSPEDGVAALPSVLEMADRHGMFVEVVALADTALVEVDMPRHVERVGAIAARFPRTLVEIANEPRHPTQNPKLADRAFVRTLRALVPSAVPTATGAPPDKHGRADGDYITLHLDRAFDEGGWRHVRQAAAAETVSRVTNKPVIDDEPIGAAAQASPARRDNSPDRFRAMALMDRLAGIGATFHYAGGLHARRPDAVEEACLTAWLEGLDAAGVSAGRGTTFAEIGAGAGPVESWDRSNGRRGFVAFSSEGAWAVALAGAGDPRFRWTEGWRETDRRLWPGLWLARAVRAPGP